MTNYLLFAGGPEIAVVILVILLLFGAKRIPELARGFAKGLGEFRKATEEIKQEINKSGIEEAKKDIDKGISEVKSDLRS